MVRPHCKLHDDARFIKDYDMARGAELIGGTVPVLDPAIVLKVMDHLRGDQKMLHLTLSLPHGLQASREQWLGILGFAMKRLRLPPMGTPWVAVRHVDANCDHLHAGIALRDFMGQPLRFAGQRKTTDAITQDLSRRLGLPVPQFFDPAAPRLLPITPERNLKPEAHRRLHDALRDCFTRCQPQSLDELDAFLAAPAYGYRRVVSKNARGRDSNLWAAPNGSQIRGGALGLAWEPRHLKARLAFAGALHALRLTIEATINFWALAAQPQLMKETLDVIKRANDETRAAIARCADVDRDAGDPGGGPRAAPAPRPAEQAGGGGPATGGGIARDGRQYHPDRQDAGAADGAGRAPGADRGQARPAPGRAGRAGRALIATLLRARKLARELGQWMKAEILWGKRALQLRFADHSALLVSRRGVLLATPAGPDSEAQRFASEHASQQGWVLLSGLDDWPVPHPRRQWDWLSAPKEMVARLRRWTLQQIRVLPLPGSPLSEPELRGLLAQVPGEPAPASLPDRITTSTAGADLRAVVAVSDRCIGKDREALDEQITVLKKLRGHPVPILRQDARTGRFVRIELDELLGALEVARAGLEADDDFGLGSL